MTFTHSVLAQLEKKRGCLEICQQLHTVEAAIAKAKKALIHDHLDHCLDLTVGDLSRKVPTKLGSKSRDMDQI